jgi:hypothetical protein
MSLPTIRRTKPPTKKQRAMSAAGTGGSAAVKFLKARLAWLAGKKATKVAAPAVAVGTVAVVAKKRSGHKHDEPEAPAGVNAVPPAPAGVV